MTVMIDSKKLFLRILNTIIFLTVDLGTKDLIIARSLQPIKLTDSSEAKRLKLVLRYLLVKHAIFSYRKPSCTF